MTIEEINDSFNEIYKPDDNQREQNKPEHDFKPGNMVHYKDDLFDLTNPCEVISIAGSNIQPLELRGQNGRVEWVDIRDVLPVEMESGLDDIQDEINKPGHYHKGGMDVIGYAELKLPPEQLKGAYRFNVMKYITRYEDKGQPLKDLRKCRVYLDKLIEMESDTE